MTTVPSFFPNSTHDELLARCHSERGSHVRAYTPKLMSPFDYDPAARCTDSDIAGFQRCESAEDSAVLARTHYNQLTRCATVDAPKLMSTLNSYPAAHEGVKHHDAFIPLPSDAASVASTEAASTPASSTQRCASAEDAAVLTRTHFIGRRRSSVFNESNVPKLVSSLDGYSAAHADVKHHDEFTPLPSAVASAASTPASSALDVFRAASAGFGRLNVQCKMIGEECSRV